MIQSLATVFSLLLGAAILILGNSLLGIVLPIRMGVEHVSSELTGLVMSAFYVGFILGTLTVQRVIHRVGHIRAFAALAAMTTAVLMIHALQFDIWLWSALRIATGFCMAGLYAIIESWLNVKSSNENRGQILSMYMVTSYAATFGGQFLVNTADVKGIQLFCVAALLTSLSLVPVVLTRVAGPEISSIHSMKLTDLYRASPLGVVATCGAGLLSGAFYGLGAIYASDLGLSVFQVSLFMSVPIFGGLALQYPIGRMSDRYDRRTVLMSVMVGALTASLVLSILSLNAAPLTALLVAAVFLGGFLATIYPIAVAQAFDYIDRAQMVAASGGLLLVWAIGATIGPFGASLVMGRMGPSGLFVYLAGVAFVLAGFTRYRMARRTAKPNDQQSTFVPVQTTSAIGGALDPRTAPVPEFYYDDVDPGDR